MWFAWTDPTSAARVQVDKSTIMHTILLSHALCCTLGHSHTADAHWVALAITLTLQHSNTYAYSAVYCSHRARYAGPGRDWPITWIRRLNSSQPD